MRLWVLAGLAIDRVVGLGWVGMIFGAVGWEGCMHACDALERGERREGGSRDVGRKVVGKSDLDSQYDRQVYIHPTPSALAPSTSQSCTSYSIVHQPQSSPIQPNPFSQSHETKKMNKTRTNPRIAKPSPQAFPAQIPQTILLHTYPQTLPDVITHPPLHSLSTVSPHTRHPPHPSASSPS